MITSFKMASYESEIECQYQEMMKQLEKEKRQTTEQQLQNRLRRQRLAQDADNVSTKAMAAELGNHVLHVLRKNNEHDVGPSEDQIQNVLQMTMQQMKDQLNEQREDDYSELSGSYSSRGPSLSRSRSPHQMGPAARDGRMDQFGDFRGPHHMRQGQQFPPRLQFRPGQKVPSDQLPLLMRNIERQLRAGNMNQRQECHLRSLYDYYAYQLSGHEGRSDRFARGPSSAFGDQSIEPWQDMQQGDEYSSNMSNYGRGGMYSPRGRNGTYPSGSQQEFDRAAAFGRHQFRGRQTFDHATRFGGHGGGRGRGMHPPRGRGQQGFDRAVGFGRVRHAFDHDANVGRGGMYSPRGRGLEMYGGGPAFNQGGMHYSGAEDEMYFSGDDYSYDHSGSFQEDSMYPSEVPYSQDVYSQSWVTDDSQWRKRRYSDLGNEKVILRHGTSKWFCKPCKLDFSDIYTLKEHVEHEEHLFRKQSHNAREESAIIKQGEDKKWYCVVCALYFDDWDSLTVHLRSTTHMKRKVDVDNGAPVPSQSTSDTTSDEENPIIKKCGDNTWYCEVCTEYCDDWDELTAHIRSEIHLQNRSHDEMFMNQSSRPKHYSGGYGDEFGGSGPGSEGNHSYTVCLESPLVLELMQKCGLRVNKMYNSLEELLAAENRITIEKRLNEMIVSESGDDLCLICFNAVPKGNSEQHKGSAQHAHSLGHYQTILEMMNVVKKLYNPDTQEEAFKLAEAYEDKLKVDCTTQHCSLCKEYYADMTRGKHLKDAMHCRLMRLAITVVGVSKAIKEQNSKNLQQFIQIHEGRLFGKKEPSSFCEICQRIVYPPYLAHGFTKLHNYNVYNLEELVICLHPLKTYINESMDSE